MEPLRLAARLCLGCALSLAWLGSSPCSAAGDDAKDESGEADEKADDEAGADSEATRDEAENEKAKNDDASTEENASKGEKDFGHRGQFGLRAGLVAGFRMILRYSKSPFCAPYDPDKRPDRQQKFCGHTAPLAADLGLSFGVFDFLEPFAWARLGLAPEKETATDPLVVLGAGVRLYTMSDAAFKILIEPAIGWELEGGRKIFDFQSEDLDYENDFVFHIAIGPQFDFTPNIGAYLTGGLSAAFIRALGSSLELNLGVQGRYP